MARLIDLSRSVEIDPVVAGFPVVEFVGDATCDVEFVPAPRKTSGARLDRSFDVIDWFDR